LGQVNGPNWSSRSRPYGGAWRKAKLCKADDRMLNLKEAYYRTAGAFVSVQGLYPFVLGWKLYHGKIPVIRLGGEMEADETGWQTAQREAQEEAQLSLRPVAPQKTYLASIENQEIALQEMAWDEDRLPKPKPVFLVEHRIQGKSALSLMYLAQSAETPVPAAEVKGIVLLDWERIFQICQGAVTLGQYLDTGGQAIFRAQFDRNLVLEPFIQLRIFAHLLKARLV